MVVHPDTDNPRRFAAGSAMSDEAGTPIVVERSQSKGDTLLVRFEGIDDRTAAEELKGTRLYIGADERRSLEEDEFWPDDLIGLTVLDHQDRVVGTVVGVIEGAAQFRLEIDGEPGRFEVPFVAELVPDVDVAAQTVRLADVPGLIPGT